MIVRFSEKVSCAVLGFACGGTAKSFSEIALSERRDISLFSKANKGAIPQALCAEDQRRICFRMEATYLLSKKGQRKSSR